MTVTPGKVVSVEYTLRLDDREVFESNVGGDPLTYTHGSQEIIPGLEKALEGMKVGETKQVTVAPEDAYGVVHPEGIFEVEKSRIPSEGLKVGAQLQGSGPDGRPVYPRVSEIKGDTVVLDLNHPLAGKTLHFDVKVLDIKTGETVPQ
ncbi:FKBP-type peptidyl-prolyl cis-trans isomerase [Candidatus Nitrospira bockiana]